MTPETLHEAIGCSAERAEAWAAPLTAAMAEFGIEGPHEQASFLAQVAHESQWLKRLEENLNYSASGLAKTWGRFSDTGKPGGQPNPLALACAYNPRRIANTAYGGRMGNVGPDDGWIHRGAGCIHLTGKSNQEKCAAHFGIPVGEIGAWLRTIEGASRSAAWFWSVSGLDRFDDDADAAAESKIVQGGSLGLANRQALLEQCLAAFGVT